MRSKHQTRLEEIQYMEASSAAQALYRHARPTGVKWIDGLAGTVRPLLTYAFFALYAVMKYAQWCVALKMIGGGHWSEAILNIWDLEDQALFATIVSFWFGQRMIQKSREILRK